MTVVLFSWIVPNRTTDDANEGQSESIRVVRMTLGSIEAPRLGPPGWLFLLKVTVSRCVSRCHSVSRTVHCDTYRPRLAARGVTVCMCHGARALSLALSLSRSLSRSLSLSLAARHGGIAARLRLLRRPVGAALSRPGRRGRRSGRVSGPPTPTLTFSSVGGSSQFGPARSGPTAAAP
jgi:hypothetical protein